MRRALFILALLPAVALAQPAPPSGGSNCNKVSAACRATQFNLLAGNKLCLDSTTCSATLYWSAANGSIMASEDFTPSADGAYVIGKPSLQWAWAYIAAFRDVGDIVRVAVAGSTGNSYKGNPVDGASAVEHTFAGAATLANATAKIASFQNGTTEKAYIDKDGNYQGLGFGVGAVAPTSLGMSATGSDLIMRAASVIYLQANSGTVADVRVTSAGLDMSNNSANHVVLAATDNRATPGGSTTNKPSGQNSIANGASAVTISNTNVTTASICLATLQETDAGCTAIKSVVQTANQLVITANANCTNATSTDVAWVCFN